MTARGRARTLTIVAVSVILVAGVSVLAYELSGNAARSGVVYSSSGPPALSFRYPGDWRVGVYTNDVSVFFRSIAFLSNQAMYDPCGGESTTGACGYPVSTLTAGGVLVSWSAGGPPGMTLGEVPGRPLTIAGRPARLAESSRVAESGHGCGSLGGAEDISAVIQARAHSFVFIQACLSPPVAANAGRVQAMLRSTRIGS